MGESPGNESSLRSGEHAILEKGSISRYRGEAYLVFRNMESWRSHYALHRGDPLDRLNAPQLDFGMDLLLALHTGEKIDRSVELELVSVTFDSTDRTLQVRWRERTLASNPPATPQYPYLFARILDEGYEIRFIRVDSVPKP